MRPVPLTPEQTEATARTDRLEQAAWELIRDRPKPLGPEREERAHEIEADELEWARYWAEQKVRWAQWDTSWSGARYRQANKPSQEEVDQFEQERVVRRQRIASLRERYSRAMDTSIPIPDEAPGPLREELELLEAEDRLATHPHWRRDL